MARMRQTGAGRRAIFVGLGCLLFVAAWYAASPSIPEVRFDQVTLTHGAHGARGHSRAGAPSSRPVIADLTFEAHGGHIVGVAGPSGIGKTTLLRLVAGLLTPTDGVVTRRFSRLGYVFQEPRLLPWKTALDNVALPLVAMGRTWSEARATGLAHLAELDLANAAPLYPAQLSGGMAQRVGLARALAIEPDLLLLDEPFAALDAERRAGLLERLRASLVERPTLVFYVTHYAGELDHIATRRFTFVGAGQVVESGAGSGR
jgi:NitT/TauT family transport system ATP-binding protein